MGAEASQTFGVIRAAATEPERATVDDGVR